MSDIITSYRENTPLVRTIAMSALKAAQTGQDWMFEMRQYRVRDVSFEDGALVIRGVLLTGAGP